MLKQMNAKQLTEMSQSILHSYYGGMTALILDCLHSDIVWINSVSGQCLYGYYNVSGGLLKLPRQGSGHVKILHSHITSLSPGISAVSCEYTLPLSASDIPPAQKQYASFIWKCLPHDCKLVYVHISSCPPCGQPAQMLTLPGNHAQSYRVPPDEILYVEASNIQSLLCCRSGQITVNQSISKLILLLPSYFMRVHRCFIVNKQYVRRVYRCGVELSNGTQVPIPEKRYMDVVCWLEN